MFYCVIKFMKQSGLPDPALSQSDATITGIFVVPEFWQNRQIAKTGKLKMKIRNQHKDMILNMVLAGIIFFLLFRKLIIKHL